MIEVSRIFSLAGFTRMIRKFRGNRDGSVAVEFAILMPAMLAMLFGIIEMGRLAYTYAALNFAAQQASRYAIVQGYDGNMTPSEQAAVEANIEQYAADQLIFVSASAGNFTVDMDPDVTGISSNTYVISIYVDYDHEFILPYIFSNGIHIRTTSSGFIAFGS